MGRLISNWMSYRNHYMCSGEANSINSVLVINIPHQIYNINQDFIKYMYVLQESSKDGCRGLLPNTGLLACQQGPPPQRPIGRIEGRGGNEQKCYVL